MTEITQKTRHDEPDVEFGKRARHLRTEVFGETLDEFAERIQAHGWDVGKEAVSRIERARMYKPWCAVEAYASADPERRGRLWWGWGLAVDDLLAQPRLQEIAREAISPPARRVRSTGKK